MQLSLCIYRTFTMSTPLDKTAPIAIVGAGVFGLSSAIHLVRRGYRNVTVFDRQPYHETLYDFDRGCDAASAGILTAPKVCSPTNDNL